MKLKNKGRKIYKTKEKNYYGKTPVGKFFSAALSVLLIGGICFIGYSVAEPIINYTKKQGDSSVSTDNTENGNSGTSSQATAATVNVQENVNIEQYKAAALSVTDMADTTSLKVALMSLPTTDDIEYVEVPLKVSGGRIYYSSSVYEAQISGAVASYITLQEIVSEIRTAGYKPAAVISMFDDNIMPLSYPQMGYITAQSGQQWIDDALDNGGKPWVTPFSDDATVYLRSIAQEVSAAGFEKIICSDFVFPEFRESDLALLGEDVNGSDRYLAMTSAANAMYDTILSNGATMMLEVSASDILKGNAEVIQPMLLDVNTIILNIDFDELGTSLAAGETIYDFSGSASENASKVVGIVQESLSDFNVAVRFSGENTEENELLKAKEKIAGEYGYSSYVIG